MEDKRLKVIERYERATELVIVEQFKLFNNGIWEFNFNWTTDLKKPKNKFIFVEDIFNEIQIIKTYLYDYQFLNVYFEIFKKALLNDKLAEDEDVNEICVLVGGLLDAFNDKYINVDVWGAVKKWRQNYTLKTTKK